MGFACINGNKECDGCGSCQESHEDELICECCEQPIVDDYYYMIGSDILCKDCLDLNFKHEKG